MNMAMFLLFHYISRWAVLFSFFFCSIVSLTMWGPITICRWAINGEIVAIYSFAPFSSPCLTSHCQLCLCFFLYFFFVFVFAFLFLLSKKPFSTILGFGELSHAVLLVLSKKSKFYLCNSIEMHMCWGNIHHKGSRKNRYFLGLCPKPVTPSPQAHLGLRMSLFGLGLWAPWRKS